MRRLYFFIALISLVYSLTINPVNLSPASFKLHPGEHTTVLTLDKAVDARLTAAQDRSMCKLIHKTVKIQSQIFTIIEPEEFKDHDFESDTPLNFRRFIGQAQIKDGVLVITSDSIVYLLKFNYNQIYNTHEFHTYGHSGNFASVVWKGDIQELLKYGTAKTEIPQIIYLEAQNQAVMIYSEIALTFSVTQMEQSSTSLQVHQVENWMRRKARGLTKEEKGVILSAVGQEGLDVYRVNQNGIQFVYNIQLSDFMELPGTLNVVDFAFLHISGSSYQLFLLDSKLGVLCAQIELASQSVKFLQRIEPLKPFQGGIAIDSKNGKNVFVGYKLLNRYFVREYIIDLKLGTWQLVKEISTLTTILGIEVGEEFAIVQGLNQHQIIFISQVPEVTQRQEKVYFTHLGLRDFAFFHYTYQEQLLKQLEGESYADFFFGFTASEAFLIKFKVLPTSVVCADNQLDRIDEYQLAYNETVLIDEKFDSITQKTLQFKVQVVNTLFFIKDKDLIIIVSAGVGLAILIFCGMTFVWCIQKRSDLNTLKREAEQQKHSSSKNQTYNRIVLDQTSGELKQQ